LFVCLCFSWFLFLGLPVSDFLNFHVFLILDLSCQVVPGFRVRIIPVLGSVPAIFGQVMASYVVTKLAGFQVEYEPVVNFDMDHYRILHQRLIEHEELVYGTASEVQVCCPPRPPKRKRKENVLFILAMNGAVLRKKITYNQQIKRPNQFILQ